MTQTAPVIVKPPTTPAVATGGIDPYARIAELIRSPGQRIAGQVKRKQYGQSILMHYWRSYWFWSALKKVLEGRH